MEAAKDDKTVERLAETKRNLAASNNFISTQLTPQNINNIYEQKIIELKAEQEFKKQELKADKKDILNEIKEIQELKELKEYLLKEKKKVETKKFTNTGIKIDSYIDNVEQFWIDNAFFYDKTLMFWLWNNNKYCYERTDEIEIMNLIDDQLGFAGQTIAAGIRGNYLEAFKRVGRKHLPIESPKTWVQFKDKIIDIQTGEELNASPKYFITNPIPWTISNNEETPIIDKLFNDWQGINKNTLYEVLSYCLLPDYPIHIIFAMIGTGRNGKTQYQKIIEHFLGQDNITSAELDSLVKERFESAKLYKKLVCTMGETNFGMMSQTSLLKKLCGGDLISYEFKNKMPFTGHNYAKIIINTNSLPASNDTTEGFYRRWLILNWDNNFEESGKDIVDIIPEEEYNNLCRKCINVLKELLKKGHFSTQGTIDERKNKYILASNPLGLFLLDRCEMNDTYYIKAKDLYHEYLKYLQEKKRRIIKRKEFNQLLAEEGYQAEHKDKRIDNDYVKSYWVEGLRMKPLISLNPLSSLLHLHYEETKCDSSSKWGEQGGLLNNECILGFESVSLMIEESVDKKLRLDTLISYGVSETTIQQWKDEGLIFENPVGYINLI